MEEKIKIKSFTDLDAWKEGHKLVLLIYQITKRFPRDEQFGLIGQMRRCAVSVTSNIAEGFSRNSFKDKLQFYYVAQGSLTELQNQLLVSHDVGYLVDSKFSQIIEQIIKVQKIINGLIKKCKAFIRDT